MKIRFLFGAFALGVFGTQGVLGASVPAEKPENIVISGGVSLIRWEQLKPEPHDKWWMNFVRAARIRVSQIREAQPDADITWLVYKPAYVRRAPQEGRDLLPLIESVRDAYKVKLVYFSTTPELIRYLNQGKDRSRFKVSNLEYFGHSNKACWMFDYSNYIDSASKVWLHESELHWIERGVFSPNAFVKSWGCHSGESMIHHFRKATGVRMWGVTGKTQYQTNELPKPATSRGRWKH